MTDRRLGVLVGVVLLPLVWLLVDLFFRVELPGAAWLAHGALRLLVTPLEWLTVDGTGRLRAVLVGWCLLGAVAAALRGRVWVAWSLPSAALLLVGQSVFIAVAGLMERAAAVGVIAVVAMASIQSTGTREQRSRWVSGALGIGTGLAAAAYVFALFTSDPTGYDMLHDVGARVRASSVRPQIWVLGVAAGLGLGLGALRGRHVGWRQLALSLGVGGVATVLGWVLLDGDGPLGSPLVLVPAASLIVLALRPGPVSLAEAPRLLVGPCLAAALLMAGTYGSRVYRCPEPGAIDGLRRVGTPSEVFRVVPGPEERFVALALRRDKRIGRWSPDTGALDLDGPLLDGAPEELVFVPDVGFFTSLVTEDPPPPVEQGAEPPTNLLTVLDPDARRIVRSDWVRVPCWVNTMAFRAADGGLYVGCEDRAGLYRLDPRTDAPTMEQTAPALGDVQALAFADDAAFSVSLWRRPTATRIGAADLAIEAQGLVGGTHFDVAYDAVTDRLFATSWYGSRVRVIEGRTLRTVATLPTGFGARAVALDPERRLLLVSSVYDGRVRVFGLDDLELRASLPVGGHVKDIAVLQRTGQAVFWSQCGLQTLALD